jgi:hypothetical protein
MCGHRDMLVARTQAVIAANPHLADRIMGKRVYVAPKETRITVDCRTGERTVQTDVQPVAPPAPRPAPIIVYRPTIFRPDGLRRILVVVATQWNVGVPSLLGAGRSRCLAYPRFAAMKLISERMGITSTPLGRALNRDHSTILAGLRRAGWLHENDADWRQRYDAAEAELKSAETDRAGALP